MAGGATEVGRRRDMLFFYCWKKSLIDFKCKWIRLGLYIALARVEKSKKINKMSTYTLASIFTRAPVRYSEACVIEVIIQDTEPPVSALHGGLPYGQFHHGHSGDQWSNAEFRRHGSNN